jgi:hypothetical protein
MTTAMTRTSMNPKHFDSTAGSFDAFPRSGHVSASAFAARRMEESGRPPGF